MTRQPPIASTVQQFLREAVTENVGLKALALAFAVALFAYQHGQQEEQQRTLPVGLIVRLPPDSAKRELMTPIPANLHVTLRGTTRAIDRMIQSGTAAVELDLRDATARTVAFEPHMFTLPPGVSVKIIDPPSVDLKWDDIVTRQIPVQASITGKPAGGFVVKGELVVDPAQITLEGPHSLVEVIQFARLAAFDVSGLDEGVHDRTIELDPLDPRVSYIGAAHAQVAVTVTKPLTEQRFTERPVEVIGVMLGRATPKTVDVTVKGPPEVVKALRAEQIVPRVDLAAHGIDPKAQPHGSTIVRVTVDLADAEVDIQPPSITVKW